MTSKTVYSWWSPVRTFETPKNATIHFDSQSNFLHLSFPPAFLHLVFQPLISLQTGFLIGEWQPSGLDYGSLSKLLSIQCTDDLNAVKLNFQLTWETTIPFLANSSWVFLAPSASPEMTWTRLLIWDTTGTELIEPMLGPLIRPDSTLRFVYWALALLRWKLMKSTEWRILETRPLREIERATARDRQRLRSFREWHFTRSPQISWAMNRVKVVSLLI